MVAGRRRGLEARHWAPSARTEILFALVVLGARQYREAQRAFRRGDESKAGPECPLNRLVELLRHRVARVDVRLTREFDPDWAEQAVLRTMRRMDERFPYERESALRRHWGWPAYELRNAQPVVAALTGGARRGAALDSAHCFQIASKKCSRTRRTRPLPMEKRALAGNVCDGRGWFRTSDLSRVKRALSH